MATNPSIHVPECEIIFEPEGEEGLTPEKLKTRYDACKKNPGHPTFIPVTTFGLEHLPQEMRTEKWMRSIKRKCALTVRILVRYTSRHRPDTYLNGLPFPWTEYRGSETHVRYGTGVVGSLRQTVDKECPCPICQKSDSPKTSYWEFMVKTATHIICDDSEVKCSEFDCFFDTDDREGVKKLYGLRIDELNTLPNGRYSSDDCHCICVTHDEDTANKLSNSFRITVDETMNFRKYQLYGRKGVMVSHPHGCSKRITVGNLLYITVRLGETYKTDTPIPFWPDTICRLPLKPWTSDKTQPQSWDDQQRFNKRFNVIKYKIDKIHNIKHCTYFPNYPLKKLRWPNGVKEKIYALIESSRYVYQCALKDDLVKPMCQNVKQTLFFVNRIIRIRLSNMKTSSTQTPELIDIGLLLFRCYLILVEDFLKDVFQRHINKEETECKSRVLPIVLFYLKIAQHPEIRPLFDLQGYVDSKLREYDIEDREYPSIQDIYELVMRIVTADNNIGTIHRDYAGGNDFPMKIMELISCCQATLFDYLQNVYFSEKSQNVIVDQCIQPGTEFKLPSNMFFTLPSQAKYAFRYYRGKPDTLIFPPGTKFHLINPDQSLSLDIPLPCEAEFMTSVRTTLFNTFLNYDIDSCTGSSGSTLIFKANSVINNRFLHNGVGDKSNRSGIQNVYYHPYNEVIMNGYIPIADKKI